MNNRELIYKSLEIIEKNLKGKLSVYDVSKELGFSLYYFSRLFKGITGVTPKVYMLGRQISESVNDVLNTNKKMIDIAFDYGFGTSESFSRAFQKIIGMNPSEIKKQGKVQKSKLLDPITKEKIERAKYIESDKPEFIELGPIYLVGIPFYYDSCNTEDLYSPWQNLMDNKSVISNKVIPEKYYQVQYWFANQDADSMLFYVALAVNKYKDIPIQFTAKTIPKLHYLKFQHRGLSNQVGHTYQYIYEKWFPETNYKLPYLFNFEYYGDLFKGPYNKESISEIYIPVDL